jgi:hypothetical protein
VKNVSFWALTAILTAAMASVGCGLGNRLESISITPNPADLSAPQNLQLQAVGHYTNGTTQVLAATWTFSSPSQWVNVSTSGLATCQVSGGPVGTAGIVTATFGHVTGSTVLSCSGPGV